MPADKIFDKIVPHFDLVIVCSDTPDADDRLDRLEVDFQHRLMTTNVHGGINLKDETRKSVL